MTEVTKDNVQEQIESYLKSFKIRFNCTNQNNLGCLYEIFVSSLPCYIQVEYDLDAEDDDCIIIQFFIELDGVGYSLHREDWDSTNHNASIEEEIYELIEVNKKLNKALSKIDKHVDNIKEICKEYELDYEDFITIKYKF